MTLITAGTSQLTAELPRDGHNARVGLPEIFIAKVHTNEVSPEHKEGWFLLGYAEGATPTRNQETITIKTGSPATIKGHVVIGQTMEIPVTLTSYTELAVTLAESGSISPTVTYAANGSTTVASGATLTGFVVTSAANLAVGDLLEVDQTDATYGGYKEYVHIKALNGTTVTTELMSKVPATSATVKKLQGNISGGGAGITRTIGANTTVANVRMKIQILETQTQTFRVYYFSSCDIINPLSTDYKNGRELGSIGMTFVPLSKELTNVTVQDGRVYPSVQTLGTSLVIPLQSA